MIEISNAKVYGLKNAIRVSKFPMAVDTASCDCEYGKNTKSLANAPIGSGHDNFLKGIVVQFDMRFTAKMSVELERYHFIDFISSQSTMHRITKFDLNKAYCEYVDSRIIEIMKQKVDRYNMATNKSDKERLYLEILYSNPCGMELTAGFTTNYQQLKTIYRQRKNHRLPEWKKFCEWIEQLPESKLITGGDDK